ncbi:MAG TPA: oligosaccharide flippase family protein [Cytophagaceae bacterium]|jgi:O-antigen/teichoic acid export membrane protein
MGIVIRQSFKNSIVTYIGVIIGTINVLFLYNKFLSAEQLGLFTALTSFPLVFASVAHLGTPHVAIRFFSQFHDENEKNNGFLMYLFVLPLLGFGLFLGVYAICSHWFTAIYVHNSPLLVNYYWVFPFLTFSLVYQVIFEAYSRVHLRIVVPAIVRELCLKLANSALALLYAANFLNFNQLLIGVVLVNFLALIVLIAYIKFLGKLFLKIDLSFIKKPVFKQMIRYGLWTMIGGATASALPHLEKLMLPAYEGGLEKTAIFNIALSIGMVIVIPRNAIAAISEPLLAAAWKNKELSQIGLIYKKSALNLLIIGLLLFLGVWCNIDSIFNLIPNSSIYQKGKFVVLFVGLYSVFDMGTGLNSEILRNSPYYKIDLSFYIIRFIILVLANLVLIPLYSYNGAALAMLISIIAYNLIKFVFIKQKLGFQPFDSTFLKVCVLALVTYCIATYLPTNNNSLTATLFAVCIKSLCVLFIFGGGVYYFKFSPDFNDQIQKITRR